MNCEMRSLNYEVWTVTVNYEVSFMKCDVWNIKCEVRIMLCKVWPVKYELWGMNKEVWCKNFEAWSMNYETCSPERDASEWLKTTSQLIIHTSWFHS